MKLEDAREIYYQRSTKLSDVVRQLNFAGIAIIWLFRVGDENAGIPYSDFLLWPLGCLITSATFDLLHYAYASAAWGIFHRRQEKKLSNDPEADFHAPGTINWLSNFFFWGKALLTVAAYALLIRYVAGYLIAHHSCATSIQ